jgi:outer membrane protein assembly factor BamB
VLDENGNAYVPGNPYIEYYVTPDGRGHGFTGLACPVAVSAVLVSGRVYCSRPWRLLQANYTNGVVLWQAKTIENMTASPVVGAGGVVYLTADKCLFAIQPAGVAPPLAKSAWPMFRGNPRHTGRCGD